MEIKLQNYKVEAWKNSTNKLIDWMAEKCISLIKSPYSEDQPKAQDRNDEALKNIDD